LPRALGKHLAVAGAEAFIADTPQEAWAMARRPKIYANRG
jgi:hypothetical protein